MLCEKCGKYKASTRVRTNVNGVVVEKNLCGHCVYEEGLSVAAQNPLGSMLASMFGEVLETKPQNTKQCPICGSTFSQIAKSGKAGCTQCYDTFRTELLPYLKRVHGSVKHIGKTPEISPNNDTIEELREKLKLLVAEENYEEAAVIRDKIKSLEAQDNG